MGGMTEMQKKMQKMTSIQTTNIAEKNAWEKILKKNSGVVEPEVESVEEFLERGGKIQKLRSKASL